MMVRAYTIRQRKTASGGIWTADAQHLGGRGAEVRRRRRRPGPLVHLITQQGKDAGRQERTGGATASGTYAGSYWTCFSAI